MKKKSIYSVRMSLLYRGVSLCPEARSRINRSERKLYEYCCRQLGDADGSVMTSQTCDGTSRTWMEVMPAQKWADTAKLDL